MLSLGPSGAAPSSDSRLFQTTLEEGSQIFQLHRQPAHPGKNPRVFVWAPGGPVFQRFEGGLERWNKGFARISNEGTQANAS